MRIKNYFLKFFLIAVLIIAAVFLANYNFPQWSAFFAKLMFLQKTGAFVLEPPASRCVNQSPEILLSWEVFNNTSFYVIERKPADQRKWQKIGQVPETVFIDQILTGKSGQYSYRIEAEIRGVNKFSNVQNITLLSCQTTQIIPPQPTATSTIWWGAYVGWQIQDAAEFEQKVGKQMNHQAVFVHWGNENEFPAELAKVVKDKGQTFIIFWEAMDYTVDSTEQPRFSYDAILRGDWDGYFTSFADSTKAYGGPIILIPFEEMNGDWTPWSGTKNGNSPQKHIAAWRYLHKFFEDATNVKFGWAINHDSVPDLAINYPEMYYPGDDYVDYVGVNGFNFGEPWQTFDEIFADALTHLKIYQKPIYIFSFASAQGSQKADWITDALTGQIPKHQEIIGWNWFNENKEKDWRVWSDENSLEAFKTALP